MGLEEAGCPPSPEPRAPDTEPSYLPALDSRLDKLVGNVHRRTEPQDTGIFLRVEHHGVAFAFGDKTDLVIDLFQETARLGQLFFLILQFGGFGLVVLSEEFGSPVELVFQTHCLFAVTPGVT